MTMPILFENGAFILKADGVYQKGSDFQALVRDNKIELRGSDTSKFDIPSAVIGKPEYFSDFPILNVCYQIAASEANHLHDSQNLFSTGDHWSTIWTRDTAYATHLGLAFWDCPTCRESLKSRVAHGEIIQDTGTGGSWPISSDRVVWALGAWEVYLASGDREWLEWSADVLTKTFLRDEAMIMDIAGLMKGESSFLDWREQSYPAWMTPSDIGDSVALSTMMLHSQSRLILSKMLHALGDETAANDWMKKSNWLINLIDQFFKISDSDLYGQYLYGRGYPVLSPKIDVLANLFCLLDSRLVNKQKATQLLAMIPHGEYGVPCFYPQISAIKHAYHNCATWPFVEGYYLQAAAIMENEEAWLVGMSSLIRGVLLCGTCKENLHLESGMPHGLVSSSDSQLWSVSAILGMIYKGLFGLQYDEHSLTLWPFVPKALKGTHRLTNLSYRDAILDIEIRGYGNQISYCLIDGKPMAPVISEHMSGHHVVEIEMIQSECLCSGVRWIDSSLKDLDYPKWRSSKDGLAWDCVEGADFYRVYKNGVPIAQTEQLTYATQLRDENAQYQIMAASLDGRESFLNAPNEYVGHSSRMETRPCGLSGDDVWVSKVKESPNALCYDVNIVHAGMYRIDAWYANGTYDLANGNTCAIRSIYLNGQRVGALAFPHCSQQAHWEHFNYSTSIEVPLVNGVYQLEIVKDSLDDNMNVDVNDLVLKHLRLTRI